MAMEVVNYRPSWQKLRCSTLALYNPYGGITTAAGADDAVKRFENYIEDANPAKQLGPDDYVALEITRMKITQEEEYSCRLFRVANYLRASINGLSSQEIYEPITQVLRVEYDKVYESINLHHVQRVSDNWNWEPIKVEMEKIWREERYWFTAIYDDMQERIKEKKKTGDDMFKFIAILDEINRMSTY